MVTDNISAKTSERLWQFMSAALFALGGIWLQNQFNMMTDLQKQLIDLRKEQAVIIKEMDSRYVPMHSLNRIWTDSNNRMNMIEAKLDRLIELNNGNNRPHTHDEAQSGGR